MLRFHREPLYQVVQELNRYTRKKILIEDAAVMEMSVYAAVNVKELDSALNALEQLLPIEITKHYDRIVITVRTARLRRVAPAVDQRTFTRRWGP